MSCVLDQPKGTSCVLDQPKGMSCVLDQPKWTSCVLDQPKGMSCVLDFLRTISGETLSMLYSVAEKLHSLYVVFCSRETPLSVCCIL